MGRSLRQAEKKPLLPALPFDGRAKSHMIHHTGHSRGSGNPGYPASQDKITERRQTDMMEAVASILAVGGLAFITFGVYRGAPALKQKSSPAANAALVFIPFGLGYWIGGIILLALELQ